MRANSINSSPERLESLANSPRKETIKQPKLEQINETDSFCTDSSYVCSPDFFKSSPNGRGNAASREAFHRWDKEDPKIGEIKEEDSEEGDVEELKVKRNV